MARQDKCFLMEGYLDVLSMHQAGILNCVASSGTSLTEEQIRIIRKFTSNVTVMYDGDSAGLHAALRAIGMILKEGMNPRVVFLPDGDDPDSYSRKHTLEEVRSFIEEHEQDGIAFKTGLLLQEAGDDPLKKAQIINELADTVADIPDAIKRQVYVDAVARQVGIDADIIQERVRKTREQEIRSASGLGMTKRTFGPTKPSAMPGNPSGSPSVIPSECISCPGRRPHHGTFGAGAAGLHPALRAHAAAVRDGLGVLQP